MGRLLAGVIVAAIGSVAQHDASAQSRDRTGKEVVDAVCAACHGTGAQGAPKIGDAKAWSKRAAQGLTALTQNAINGIRQMPAHGGNPNVTDFEIERAVTYMVNHSGGSWAEPIDKSAPLAARSGEQVVQAQCSKCHQTGEGGAPRIGDHAAWTPRLRQGLDAAVRSAIKGHGGMPARGGLADLTDAEVRSAVIYMFNPVSAASKGAAPPVLPVPAGNRKVVGGMEIYLGVVSAESLRAQQQQRQGGAVATMHGGIPRGKDYYHVNISLVDDATKADIADAQVEATVEEPGLSVQTEKLELMALEKRVSYGNYFRMPGKDPYSIEVRIWRPGAPAPVSTKFSFRHG
ncbi:MAG TPA: c-type cytochrome [Burkholderiales bacterium]|nr:c-type cytochrome [Burkholderiales bacterium]